MKFLQVIQALYCEPWMIMPSMHQQMCDIFKAHMDGTAHTEGGVASLFEDDDAEPPEPYAMTGPVAVIPITGVIGKRVSRLRKSSGVCDVEDVEAAIEQALGDQRVEGMLLHVDSPGGTVTGNPELGRMIAEAATIKPIIAFTDRLMASAAYFISAGADEIYASESAEVGSIGVYMAWLDTKRAYEMDGYKTELIKSGKYKAIGLSGTSLTDEQRRLLQAEIDEWFGMFKGFVQEHRDVPNDAMQGQTFIAKSAVAAGLVDTVGNIDDAINEVLLLAAARKGGE